MMQELEITKTVAVEKVYCISMIDVVYIAKPQPVGLQDCVVTLPLSFQGGP